MATPVTKITTDFLVIKITFIMNNGATAVTNLNDVQWLLQLCKCVKKCITLSTFHISRIISLTNFNAQFFIH